MGNMSTGQGLNTFRAWMSSNTPHGASYTLILVAQKEQRTTMSTRQVWSVWAPYLNFCIGRWCHYLKPAFFVISPKFIDVSWTTSLSFWTSSCVFLNMTKNMGFLYRVWGHYRHLISWLCIFSSISRFDTSWMWCTARRTCVKTY